ncbi:hypothetical protein D918_05215 [Trichuris suis]|nr:hypothetical protein D918_05215 [Trichuris suis]
MTLLCSVPCLPSCSSKNRSHGTFCIWEGTINGTSSPTYIGSICYKTSNFNEANKTNLPNDICSRWEYGNTPILRLAVPDELKSWKSTVLLYKPPTFGIYSN